MLMRRAVNPEHPFARFSVGSRATLNRPGIREDIIAFYRRHYSASRMSLVVLGNYTLDELQAMVTQRFVAVPNNGSRTTALRTPLLVEHATVPELPVMLAVEAKQSVKELWLTFEIDDIQDDFRVKQWDYIAHLLGHEGRGSLLSALKADGLAQWLGAGIDLYYRGGGTFGLQMGLTDRGLEQVDHSMASVKLARKAAEAAGVDEAINFRITDFFDENPEGYEARPQPSVKQRIFNQRLA